MCTVFLKDWCEIFGLQEGKGIYVWPLSEEGKAGVVPLGMVMDHKFADISKNKKSSEDFLRLERLRKWAEWLKK